MDNNPLLTIKDLYAGYIKDSHILNGVNLEIGQHETVAIIGQNGSGKSTLAKAIMGILPYARGSVRFQDTELIGQKCQTHEICRLGVGYFIQEGAIFNSLTVEENLQFAARTLDKKSRLKNIEKMKQYFEMLRDKKRSLMKATYLSGGEKHQLALAMVLLTQPKLLVLDEPSAGLSPVNRKDLFATIKLIQDELSLGMLLIEQNAFEAIKASDRTGLMNLGRVEKLCPSNTINKIDEFFWNKGEPK